MVRFPLSKKTVVLFLAGGLLLAGGGVGSTVAVLTYESDRYEANFELSEIDVQLLENGVVVADGEGFSSSLAEGKLLENMTAKTENEDGSITYEAYVPGFAYDEAISVVNNGRIDTFYRLIITKRWEREDGSVDTELDPNLIELNFLSDTGWVVDNAASTPERTIAYYTKAMSPGEASGALTDTLTVNADITKYASVDTIVEDGKTTTVTTYLYNDKYVALAAEVDGVQARSGEAAILSAWGIKASVAGDDETGYTMSLGGGN